MIVDLTCQAVEQAIAAALPSGLAEAVYCASEKRAHGLEFDYIEVIADPYTTEVRDDSGLPALASLPVYVNYIAPNDEAAEAFLRSLTGFAYAFTATGATASARALQAPFNQLTCHWVECQANGYEPQADGTLLAQFQFSITLRPLLVDAPQET